MTPNTERNELLKDVATLKATQRMCQQETSGRLTNHGDRIHVLEQSMSAVKMSIAVMTQNTQAIDAAVKEMHGYVVWGVRIVVGAILTACGSVVIDSAKHFFKG